MSRDLIALLEYLDLRDATLVGMSQGARVAMRATAHLRKLLALLWCSMARRPMNQRLPSLRGRNCFYGSITG